MRRIGKATSLYAKLLTLAILVSLVGILSFDTGLPAKAANPWHHTYTPYRNIYVTPDGVGGSAVDYSGESNTGTLLGGPASVAGKVTPSSGTGYALDLDGTNDYVTLTDPIAAWGTSYSVEGWVKASSSDNTVNTVYPILGTWGSASVGGVGQAFGIKDGKIVFSADENGSVNGCTDSTMTVTGGTVSDDAWHHVAMTLDSSTREVKIYLDGSLSASGTLDRINTLCGIGTMNWIGRSGIVSSSYYLNGAVDELRVYNTVLSASAVSTHYASGAGQSGSAESGLVAGYHFDEGTAATADNPLSLTYINNYTQPGDQVLMGAGTYTGVYSLNVSGTSTAPIVFVPLSGAHVKLEGGLIINGSYNWIWGWEITDPDNLLVDGSVVMVNADNGTHLINNVIHDVYNGSGIFEPVNSVGSVTYGNILYDLGSGLEHFKHGIYTQNDYDTNGYRYYISNMIFDQDNMVSNSFNFHAYNTSSASSGFYMKHNVSSNGRFLIGGFGKPASNQVLDQNYFYDSNAQFGYRRPTQASFTNNYLAESSISTEWFWGAGENLFNKSAPNTFTGNEIYKSSGYLVQLRTSAYIDGSRYEGTPALDTDDTFDNNTYGPAFSATLSANGVTTTPTSLSAWTTATTAAGKAFGANSTVVDLPTTARVFVVKNEYETDRGHIMVFNWGEEATVDVDLTEMSLENGDTYEIFAAKDYYGSAVASGSYSGVDISVPIAGSADFASFVVVVNDEAPPNNSLVEAPPGGSDDDEAPSAPEGSNPTMTVTKTATTSDGVCDADCSLLEAITLANSTSGADTIEFDVPTHDPGYINPDGSRTSTGEEAGTYAETPYGYFIFYTVDGFDLTDVSGVYINGYSQPNASRNTAAFGETVNANIMIQIHYELSGSGGSGACTAVPQWDITGSYNHLAGLNIIPCSGFMQIAGESNWIEGSFIQTDILGLTTTGNTGRITVGDPEALATNTIIGTNGDGTGDAGERNVILNPGVGSTIIVNSGDNDGTIISGNYIGVDKTGDSCSNGATYRAQLDILGGTGGQFGSDLDDTSDSEEGNILGCVIADPRATIRLGNTYDNLIQGNYIGVSPNGVSIVGAIEIDALYDGGGETTGNTIKRNTIANIRGKAITWLVNGSTNNTISENTIYNNADLAIDIGDNGVSANDEGDEDTGINDNMNYPVITSAELPGDGTLLITADLDFDVNEAPFTIEFFYNDTIDSLGYGEGRYFIGSATTSEVGVDVELTVSITGYTPPAVTNITSTATNTNGATSEFSAPSPGSGGSSVTTYQASAVLGQTDGAGNQVFTTGIRDNGGELSAIGFFKPLDVAIDPVRNRLFVANQGLYRVLVFDLNEDHTLVDQYADYVLTVGEEDNLFETLTVTNFTQASVPRVSSLTFDSENNRLFAVNMTTGASRVSVFEFSSGITNGMNASYVLGQASFTAASSVTSQSGMGGNCSALISMCGMAYDSVNKYLFVASTATNRVLVYDLSSGITTGMNASYVLGQSDFTTNTAALASQSTADAASVAYDETTSHLYVADTTNNRVLVYDLSSGITTGMNASYVLGQSTFTASTAGVGMTKLSSPKDVTIDSGNQLLFVSDTGNNRIMVFDVATITNGEAAVGLLGQEDYNGLEFHTTRDGFYSNIGIDFDTVSNRLFVADVTNHRILSFDFPVISTTTLTDPKFSRVYSAGLQSTRTQGAVTYELFSGTLPTGLTVSGDLSGETADSGSHTFTLRAKDSISTGRFYSQPKTFTFTVGGTVRSGGGGGGGSTSVGSQQGSISGDTSGQTLGESAYLFTRNLGRDDTHPDVKLLQQYLNANGFTLAVSGPGSRGQETAYFGPLTYSAVKALQEAFSEQILDPLGLKRATGFFGPSTRAFINSL